MTMCELPNMAPLRSRAADPAVPPDQTVSVVIPTYNRRHTILRAIHSVLRQDWPVHEIIVVDDASTDDTIDLLDRQPWRDRIQLVRRNRCGGGPAARNAGIAVATGEWVAFLDSDDAWHPTKLSKQIRRLALLGPEHGACYTGSIARDERQRQRGVSRATAEGDIFRACLSYNIPGSTSTVMARRSLLLAAGGFAENLASCQDWDLWLRLARLTRFACVPELLTTLYVGRADRITANARGRLSGHLYIWRTYIRPQVRDGFDDTGLFLCTLGDIFMQMNRPTFAKKMYSYYWMKKKRSLKRSLYLFSAALGISYPGFFLLTGFADRIEARMRPTPLRKVDG